MKTVLTISGDCVSQKNVKIRMTNRRTGQRFVGSPKRITSFKDSAIIQLRNQWKFAPAIEEPVIVWFQIYKSHHRLQDQGNAMEAVWDAMQKARIVKNDCLVIPRALGPIRYDKENPHVEMTLQLFRNCEEPGKAVAWQEELRFVKVS